MKLSEYSLYDGVGLAKLVKQREVSPEELVEVALEAIEKLNPKLNAIAQVFSNHKVLEVNKEISNGPFEGVPFLLKELGFLAKDIRLSFGSNFIKEGIKKTYDSELMKRFRNAGFLTVGTTTTPEFGMKYTTESDFFGATRNPWDLHRSAGGSSGGSAAAVAARIVPIAHASDGSGSIRVPASCNGVVGFKPTRGRIPTGPDQGGPLDGLTVEFAVTRSVRDIAYLLDSVAGPEVGSYSQVASPQRPFSEEISNSPKRLRIAWTSHLNGISVSKDVLSVLNKTVILCEELGHELVEKTPEINFEMMTLARIRIAAARLANDLTNIAVVLKRNPTEKDLEPSTWSLYQMGLTVTATELLEAFDIMAKVSREIGKFFNDIDVLLTPTTTSKPHFIGEMNPKNLEQWKEQFMYFPFTGVFNMTGQPAISLPLGWSSDKLPIGMQFVGRFADESTLIRLSAQLEEACPWNDKRPPLSV